MSAGAAFAGLSVREGAGVHRPVCRVEVKTTVGPPGGVGHCTALRALSPSADVPSEWVVTDFLRGRVPQHTVVATLRVAEDPASNRAKEWSRFAKYLFHGVAGTSEAKAAQLSIPGLIILPPAALSLTTAAQELELAFTSPVAPTVQPRKASEMAPASGSVADATVSFPAPSPLTPAAPTLLQAVIAECSRQGVKPAYLTGDVTVQPHTRPPPPADVIGDIYASHGAAYVDAEEVKTAVRYRGAAQGALVDKVTQAIVGGSIPFPFKRKCIAATQVEVWFDHLRAYPNARLLKFGPYVLHGYYPRGRNLVTGFDGPLWRDATGALCTGASRSVTLVPEETTLLCGMVAAHIPFDREYNEIGGTIVDYFSEPARMAAIRKDEGAAPLQLWLQPHIARSAVEKALRKYGEVTDYSLRHGLYGKVSGCNLFKANLARALYELLGGTRVLDMCAGWGDRLMGAMATPTVTRYCAFDPNPALVEPHQGMIRRFGRRAGGRYEVNSVPFEAGVFPECDVRDGYDLAFTSPPYFDLEIYEDPSGRNAAGGSSSTTGGGSGSGSVPVAAANQSITTHPSQLGWMKGWYWPMLSKAWLHLREGGHLGIYINDHSSSKEGEEHLDLCFPMLQHVATLTGSVWVGVVGIEGETGKIRPLWLWRKGALGPAPPPLYQELALATHLSRTSLSTICTTAAASVGNSAPAAAVDSSTDAVSIASANGMDTGCGFASCVASVVACAGAGVSEAQEDKPGPPQAKRRRVEAEGAGAADPLPQ